MRREFRDSSYERQTKIISTFRQLTIMVVMHIQTYILNKYSFLFNSNNSIINPNSNNN
jgi:hypothetical protein